MYNIDDYRSNRKRSSTSGKEDKYFSSGFVTILFLQVFLCIVIVAMSIATKYMGDVVYSKFKNTYYEIMNDSLAGQQVSLWIDKAKQWVGEAVNFVEEESAKLQEEYGSNSNDNSGPVADISDGLRGLISPEENKNIVKSDSVKYIVKNDDKNILSIIEDYKNYDISEIPKSADQPIKTPEKVSLSPIVLWGKIQAPLDSINVSSPFGYRIHPISGNLNFHKGMDFAAAYKSKIYAVLGGTVKETGYSDTYGNYIVIQHTNGLDTFYGHCEDIIAVEGEVINQGEVIAKVGTTGLSTGYHLHFEIRHNDIAYDPNWIFKYQVSYE